MEWRMWSRGESEAGLTGFLTKKDRDDFDAGKRGPFRRVISETGNTIYQAEDWNDMVQRWCDAAGVKRKNNKRQR